MLLYGSLDFRSFNGSRVFIEASYSGEEFVEGLHELRIGWYGDGAESIFEVGEDVGYGVWVCHFDEEGVVLDAVVETVEVDEVHWFSSLII